MIDDWRPEMDLSAEKIHRLIVNYNLNIINLGKFKTWMNEKYEAYKIYGEPEAVSVWKDVIDKFEELFE